MSNEVELVRHPMEEGWSMLLGQTPLADILKTLALDEKEFKAYVKRRLKEMQEGARAFEKAHLLGQVNDCMRVAWPKRDDPKWMEIAIKLIGKRQELALGKALIIPEKDDGLDFDRLSSITKEIEQRERTEEEPSNGAGGDA